MKTLTIDLDNLFKSNIPIEWYVIGQLILEHYSLEKVDLLDIELMEQEGLIKVINKTPVIEVEPREKLIKLFEKSEKNNEALEVLNYFNTKYKEKSAKSRGFKSPSLLKNINARLKEGYTKQDLMSVIDFKFKEWWGTSMQEHLYPDTLFNSVKFPKYINQVALKGNNSWSNLV